MSPPDVPPTRGFALRPVLPRWPDFVLTDGLQGILQFCGARLTGLRFVTEDGESLGVHASHYTAEETDSINIKLSEAEEEEIVETVVKGQGVWISSGTRKPSITAVPVVDEGWTVAVLELWGMRKAPTAVQIDAASRMAAALLVEARLNRDLMLRNREIAAFHDIQYLITGQSSLQEVLDKIVRTTSEAFDGARECTIRLAEAVPNGGVNMRVAAWAGRPVTARHVWPLKSGTIDGEVMSGKTVAIENLHTDPRVRDSGEAKKRGLEALLTAPLRVGRRNIGALRLFLGVPHVFGDEEIELLESLASQAAIAIENARLYHQVKTAHEKLQKSYEELHSAQVELVKKEKLAALGEMSALVAHEIRNPLTAVRGFAQRVQRKVADQPRLAQSCQIIIDEVDRLNKVIVDVLDFARRLEPQMGDHSLNLLVQDVLNLETETLQQRGIQIVTDCAPALPPVRMDSGQIRQVLLNLIANARGAMSEKGGGTLTLRTRRCTDGVQCLDVVDTGPGIPKEMQEKIFTPFFTTKTHGTGLGLAVARRIAEGHGGTLALKSAKGEGATFTITIPETKS